MNLLTQLDNLASEAEQNGQTALANDLRWLVRRHVYGRHKNTKRVVVTIPGDHSVGEWDLTIHIFDMPVDFLDHREDTRESIRQAFAAISGDKCDVIVEGECPECYKEHAGKPCPLFE